MGNELVFDGATHLSYFGAFAIQEELPAKEPDSPEATPASPDYVSGPEEPEQASLLLDYVPGPEYPEYLAPSDEEEEEESSEEKEAKEEEEEHLASTDSVFAPVVDHVPSSEETEPFVTDESAATPPSPPACHTTARISIRPEAPMPFPSEDEVERLLALPPPPPSPLISLSPPFAEERLTRCLAAPSHPSPPLPPPPLSLHLPPHVPTSLPLPSSALPPLPASLFIPPPVDHREDTPEAKLPPRKRLCLTTLTSRYDAEESLTAAPRPTGGHGIDYGFIGTLDAKTRRQRAEEVGYRIRDTWVDLREVAEEIAPVTLEGVNTRVTELAVMQEQDTQDIYAVIEDAQDRQTRIFQSVEALIDDRQYHYETARLLDQEALVSREDWPHSMGLSSAVHYELQGYMTHTWMQDHCEIRALQARDQACADAPEGTASMAIGLVFSFLVSDKHNNMSPRRSSATARAAATATARAAATDAAATPMTAVVVE
ncbi:hypothetical protein Tco_1193155 [Tanacetum coccineum]